MERMRGHILAVQESRFRVSGRSASKLFILSHKAPLAPQDLAALQDRNIEVCVHYEEAEDLLAGVAYDITRAGSNG